ncbi:MAG: hypothetical protein N3G21_00145 [Candidatus Hydrogenedentes bacterium]|nr:hypothetical protein [Candidatus Hydrogenedentota bacterium]
MLVQIVLSIFLLTEINITDKFPSSIEEWVKEPEILKFTPDNLFDYIDGEAERYLPYNFQLLTVVNYRHQSDSNNKVEIQLYQMGSVLDAFGIYSVLRDSKKEKFPCGNDGFVGSNQAMFYQSKYFIKLLGNHSAISSEILLKFGKEISNCLPKESLKAREIECLSIPERVDKSEKYLPKDILSQTFFPRGFTAQVKSKEGGIGTAFVVMYDDTEKAKDGWEEYLGYLSDIGAVYEVKENRIRVISPPSEITLAELWENYIVGIWVPGGNISNLEEIYLKIVSCLKREDISHKKGN